jgi:hypothetical protein
LYYFSITQYIEKLKNIKENYLRQNGIGDWGLGIGDWAQSPIPISYFLFYEIIYILKN